MLQVLPFALHLLEHPILGSQVSACEKSSENAVTFAVLLLRQTQRCLRDLLHSSIEDLAA